MDTKLPKRRQISETTYYKEFSKDIDYLIDFFAALSQSILYNGFIYPFIPRSKSYHLNTELIDSSEQTLRSIKLCCSIGSFSDANTLIRKFRDDLMLYVYMHNIIDSYKSIQIDGDESIGFSDHYKVKNSLSRIQVNNTLTDDEKALIAWFENSVSDLKGPARRKLSFENYMTTLRNNKSVDQLLIKYNLIEYWETLRKKLNDYVHNNGVNFSLLNTIYTFDKNLEIHLKNISFRITYISSIFLVLLTIVNPLLIASMDYVCCIDNNIEPPKDSQYTVAEFVQEFIDTKIVKLHPELKQYLIEYNMYGMKIL